MLESRTLFDNLEVYKEIINNIENVPEDEKETYFKGFIDFITSLTV